MQLDRLARRLAGLTLAWAFALAAGCDRPNDVGGVTFSDCRLPQLSKAARCTTVTVPENRERPRGRAISIFVAVLPANTLSPQPDPLVILAGGPGQAASALAPLAARLGDIRRTRDIVLIDQRGTGRSSPLACPSLRPDDLPGAIVEQDTPRKARACVAELAAAGVDVTQYTTEAFVADLETIREALRYPRVNLWGGSYGTRVALAYLRRHPSRVRSVVLDSVVPPEMKTPVDVWPVREMALGRVFAACSASAACRERHPDLAGDLDALGRNFATGPQSISLADPVTGKPAKVELALDDLLGAVYAVTYAPERAAMLPELIGRAAAGDYAPLLAAGRAVTGDLAEQMTPALHYAVTCSEDAPRVTEADLERLAPLRSRHLARLVLDICAEWPRGTLPADYADPIQSEVPALVLSGGLDPVTPPGNGERVAAMLPGSRHVVAAAYGHIVTPHACAPQIVAAFVEHPGSATLPEACVEHLRSAPPPPLWPDAMAPRP